MTFSEYCLLVEKTVFAYACAVVCRLCAEFAVLGASAAPAVDYAAKVSMIAFEVGSDEVSAFAELIEVSGNEAGLVVAVCKPFSGNNFFCEFYHIHGIHLI